MSANISDEEDDSPSERTAIRRSVQSTAPQMKPSCRSSRRYVLALMAFLGFSMIYTLRVGLSLAVVAMTSNKTWTNENETLAADFEWNPEIESLVLSSFYYGYMLTQVLGGYLAAMYGGKRVFGIGVAVATVLESLNLRFFKRSLYVLVTAGVVEGLFEGVTYPAIHAMWSRWAPPLERTRLVMICFSGAYFGTAISFLYSRIAPDFGWSIVFSVIGFLGCIWGVLWHIYIEDKPENDSSISDEELSYIHSTLRNHSKVGPTMPWKRIFLSCPVWAIVVAHFCENWGFYMLLTEFPKYIKDVYAYDQKTSSMMLFQPYAYLCVFMVLSGYIADRIQSKGMLSTVRVRKLFSSGGLICQTVFLLLLTHVSSFTPLLLCFILSVFFGGLTWSGFGVNHLDIAPQYAGLLMGISNTFATLPGAISPVVTSYLVKNKTRQEWNVVFDIASCIHLLGAVFYEIFASGEEQPWAQSECGILGDD